MICPTLSFGRAVSAMTYCKGTLDERESEPRGVHAFDLRTWEVKTGFYRAQGCPFLYNKFKFAFGLLELMP